MEYHPYTETALMNEFARDLRAARHLVLLHVPYATPHGVKRLRPHLKTALAEGARVCVRLLKPSDWDRAPSSLEEDFDRDKFDTARLMLVEFGAHVTLCSNIHEKFCIIDGLTTWDSTLNYLSWYNTHESMNRFVCPDLAHLRTFLHGLHKCDACRGRPGHSIFAEVASAMSPAQLIAHRVKLQRHRLGLTQADLAKVTKVPERTIASVESGDFSVSAQTMLVLHEALNLKFTLGLPFMLPATDEFFEGGG